MEKVMAENGVLSAHISFNFTIQTSFHKESEPITSIIFQFHDWYEAPTHS